MSQCFRFDRLESLFDDSNVVTRNHFASCNLDGLKSGLGRIPAAVFQMWYLPFPINTWINSPTIGSIILVVIVFLVATVIWYPFFKLYDRDLVEKEDK
jgi:Phosphotransferase system cellobiose-specific component IIC